jgi:uncharacterized protein YbaA (DUF1428 family)
MTYVDGFVVPVPADKIEAYRAMAQLGCTVWKDHGALSYRECVAEDMEDKGFCATFPKAFALKEGEVAVFAYIEFKSRAHRDEVNARVMADPRLEAACKDGNMPFDPRRMAYGGFQAIVEF